MSRRFLVKCPACGNKQQILIRSAHPVGCMKKCVFCGRNFVIHKNPGDSQIEKEMS